MDLKLVKFMIFFTSDSIYDLSANKYKDLYNIEEIADINYSVKRNIEIPTYDHNCIAHFNEVHEAMGQLNDSKDYGD